MLFYRFIISAYKKWGERIIDSKGRKIVLFMNEERVTTLKTKLPNLIYLVLAFFVQLKLATYLRQYTPNNSLQH